MAALSTEVLVVGSGAGGAVTAAALAAAGRTVTVVEEGPWVDPDSVEPFSLEEMVAKYRHHGLSAALGNPAIAYAEGRCVGGSTEINSGLCHRLPDDLADEWRRRYAHRRVHARPPSTATPTGSRAELGVATVPGAPPAVVGRARAGRHQARLAHRRVRPRVPLRRAPGAAPSRRCRARCCPRAVAAGATVLPDTRVREAGPAGRPRSSAPSAGGPTRTAASSA